MNGLDSVFIRKYIGMRKLGRSFVRSRASCLVSLANRNEEFDKRIVITINYGHHHRKGMRNEFNTSKSVIYFHSIQPIHFVIFSSIEEICR